MRLASIKTFVGGLAIDETAGILTTNGIVPIQLLNKIVDSHWSTDIYALISKEELKHLNNWYKSEGKNQLENMEEITVPYKDIKYAPLYRNPGKIFCIGLNYQAEADTINDIAPSDIPGSFYKPPTTIIGTGEAIKVPLLPYEINNRYDNASVVDGEAELVVIIGKKGKNIKRENWLDYVAGFTTSIESTVIDVFNKGLRKLCISKSFDTHFAFGPVMITPDEIEDVMKLKVRTVLNDHIEAEDFVGNMIFPPDYIVSFHSEIMTLMPGDVISTGTPKGANVQNGDVIRAEIDGFTTISCPVINEQ